MLRIGPAALAIVVATTFAPASAGAVVPPSTSWSVTGPVAAAPVAAQVVLDAAGVLTFGVTAWLC
jgi:hypothetical protein